MLINSSDFHQFTRVLQPNSLVFIICLNKRFHFFIVNEPGDDDYVLRDLLQPAQDAHNDVKILYLLVFIIDSDLEML